jgi:hypothetical protein
MRIGRTRQFLLALMESRHPVSPSSRSFGNDQLFLGACGNDKGWSCWFVLGSLFRSNRERFNHDELSRGWVDVIKSKSRTRQ